MAENIEVSDIIPARPERVYSAWLDADQHGAMTGSSATDEGGGRFTAWDGYISGRTVSAVPHSKIVQAWRTSEFPADDADSILTVTFAAEGDSTRVTLKHENIPADQGASYAKGWDEFYFTPMKRYFGSAMEKVREAFEDAGDQVEAVAAKTVKAVKKVQKKATAQLKAVGKKVKALVSRKKKKPAPKKKAPAKARTKKAAPKKKKR
jgi:uncharacterized protein YndB with AHSA1/START domain